MSFSSAARPRASPSRLTTCKRINACDLANLLRIRSRADLPTLPLLSSLPGSARTDQQRHRRGVFLEVLCQLFHRRAAPFQRPSNISTGRCSCTSARCATRLRCRDGSFSNGLGFPASPLPACQSRWKGRCRVPHPAIPSPPPPARTRLPVRNVIHGPPSIWQSGPAPSPFMRQVSGNPSSAPRTRGPLGGCERR